MKPKIKNRKRKIKLPKLVDPIKASASKILDKVVKSTLEEILKELGVRNIALKKFKQDHLRTITSPQSTTVNTKSRGGYENLPQRRIFHQRNMSNRPNRRNISAIENRDLPLIDIKPM
mmetsp:Transcript_6761/g.5901  ORF Transcript_6761/g.5901 Transcript_6761/m.5901 type:complete len:118 (+) Transcript_6761:806-1159(+)